MYQLPEIQIPSYTDDNWKVETAVVFLRLNTFFGYSKMLEGCDKGRGILLMNIANTYRDVYMRKVAIEAEGGLIANI